MTFHAREGRYTAEQLKAKKMGTSTGRSIRPLAHLI
jgi:hypothetical protein